MTDETLKCADCAKEFPFTEKDQKFYADKGFCKPKRCKPCRVQRKALKDGKGRGE